MRVTVAKSLGTCFGVQDAIDLAMDESYRGDLTVIGQLVHNPQTIQQLQENGANIVDKLSPDIHTKHVMITAHGAPESVHRRVKEMGFTVLDASCPLVLRVHKAVSRFVRAGYHPVVIGDALHVEVKGIVGDLEDYTVIRDQSEIDKLKGRARVGIVSQTTQQIDFVLKLVGEIRERFPQMEVEFCDTVCQPTKARQVAVRELAKEVDVMIVVGGHNSSNTKKLALVCAEMGVEAHHIERASELDPRMFDGKEHVGITAGTSTPREVIENVYQAIIHMPGVDISECSDLPPKEKYLH
ncbi:MAG: 4-hydroxy-3-methylbut-2-enyl diphosphate reductase [Planctomycetes bacterium]|nr:4-hydroxy-3-methylbut-2-enyl diphosphate reductase [Planctomycetota bacterium]